LTAEVEQRLSAVGLISFFEGNRPLFTDMARTAYAYADSYVTPAKLPVRIDDVAVALELALRLSEPFGNLLAKERLTQRYWYRYFADLILDRLWKELP